MHCNDCEEYLEMGDFLTLRCTLDNEDVTHTYCAGCFAKRMANWLGTLASNRLFYFPEEGGGILE